MFPILLIKLLHILGHTYITFGDTSVIALLKKYLQASKLNHVVLLLDDRPIGIDLQNDTAQLSIT